MPKKWALKLDASVGIMDPSLTGRDLRRASLPQLLERSEKDRWRNVVHLPCQHVYMPCVYST